jgi:hypothetical protein
LLPYVDAAGVGSDDEKAASQMRGADVPRRQIAPLRIEPEIGKVAEHSSQPTCSQPKHVFDDGCLGLKLRDGAGVLAPQPRSRPFESCALTCKRDVLTREASTQESHGWYHPILHLLYVRYALRGRPVLGEHSAAKRIDLGLEKHLARDAGPRKAPHET